MNRSPCLTETQLLSMIDAAGPPDAAAHSDDHLDECAECRSLLIYLMKSLPAVALGEAELPAEERRGSGV